MTKNAHQKRLKASYDVVIFLRKEAEIKRVEKLILFTQQTKIKRGFKE